MIRIAFGAQPFHLSSAATTDADLVAATMTVPYFILLESKREVY